MKLKPLTRTVDITRAASTDRTVEFSFSSEMPVDRWFGKEVLDHGAKAARLGRLNDGAPLLFNHNMDDLRGIVEKAWIGQDRRGYAKVRLADTPAGNEALKLVQDGILRNVSFMYRVHAWEEPKASKSATAEDEFRVTDWEPLEVSLVTVPADQTVGIGRSFVTEELEVQSAPSGQDGRGAQMEEQAVETAGPAPTETRVEVGTDRSAIGAQALQIEKDRKTAIRNLCSQFKIDERIETRWVQGGTSLNQVSDELIAIQREREELAPRAAIGMDRKEVRRYSLVRALRSLMNNSWEKGSLELEAHRSVMDKTGRQPKSDRSIFVPLDVMMRDLPRTMLRDMTAAGVSGSNYLVSTDNMPGSFIELLRNQSVALQLGVQRLSGLVGNVTIPKMTAGATGYWLTDETTAITESQPTIGQLALSPKNVAALTEFTHQLMQQSSPDVENLVMTTIARDLALAVDVGIIRGTGSNGQPTGITATASIGGFTGTSLAATGILNGISDVGAANALNSQCAFATTHAVAALLMDRPNVTSATDGTPLWQGRMDDGTLRGYRAMASGQMAAATMLFGWWQSVILAEWGVLELAINPFSDFTRGYQQIRGWYTVDVGVRYAGAWSYASSIT